MYPFQHLVEIFTSGKPAILDDHRLDRPFGGQYAVGLAVDVLIEDQFYPFPTDVEARDVAVAAS